MPLNNPLSLSSRGGRSNARPFFSQIFVDGLPPWESDRETSYFRDASGRRFIREIFPFALSSLSLSLSGRREITESLRVSWLLSPRLLISTFRGLNIASCTFCGLRAGKKEEICILRVSSIFTPIHRVSNFVFFFSRKSWARPRDIKISRKWKAIDGIEWTGVKHQWKYILASRIENPRNATSRNLKHGTTKCTAKPPENNLLPLPSIDPNRRRNVP